MKVVVSIAAAALISVGLIDASRPDSRTSEVVTATAARADFSTQALGDSGSIRELIDGIRGANAIQCELLLQGFHSWSSGVADRDVNAWKVSQRFHRDVVDAGDIAWLGEQMRAPDVCAARASARMLGNSESPAARTLLLSSLGHANAQVRRLAAVGIGYGSDSTVSRRLVPLLRDADPGVRAAAAWALGAVH
ncbi:MAG TPA: HEAT repeat domain-containing protein [Gemmatimonadaceae bacterium]|nr:HEAT repeat domain-containing protein [Gemmatimonadaceae bacterium]